MIDLFYSVSTKKHFINVDERIISTKNLLLVGRRFTNLMEVQESRYH